MKIRRHVPAPGGRWCLVCGGWKAAGAADWDEALTCIERDDGLRADQIMPEPKRRDPACEDAAAIAARLLELAAEERTAALNHEGDE